MFSLTSCLLKEANITEICIKDLIPIQNKGLAVICHGDQDDQTLQHTINNKETLKATIQTKMPRKRHTSNIIYNIPEHITRRKCNKYQGSQLLAKDCPANRPSCGSYADHHPPESADPLR
ncbi:hypothetical protein AVEN_87604-1 [Araneus ventricosus]|uniref:Uncharacterized protein n=1 Tax=Araneus ventricosus TaxID=182803 RepID=A0A4Y2LV18_ARAVE|nr:hypothetical protein AVEN_87604-1 [Araneus ventricosus]